jgi:prepilin-type N-terminal cleavage/methylation domain-containing protein/prepilin-type processing-associated H-X9-DG protein
MHAQPPKNWEKSAFTLTELLVVIAIIAVLATLRLSALAPTAERVHRLGCLNNLKQLGMGSMMYASDFNGHYSSYTWFEMGFTPTAATDRSGSDDDLSWLYPRYVKSISSFVCPATLNYIRTNLITKPTGETALSDLCNNGTSPKSAGTSYECFGTFGVRTGVGSASTSTKKKEDTVNAFTDWYYPPALGMKPGPSRIFLITDADDTAAVLDPTDINNWPNSLTDNHGAAGQNFSFCDGHAQWVRQSKFMQVWNISQDSNRVAGVN